MKAKKNGECEGCGNPGIMANVTRVLYARGKISQCEVCNPDLAKELDETSSDALHTIRVRVIGQRYAKPDGSYFIYIVELNEAKHDLPDGTKKPFGATGPIGQFRRDDIITITGRFTTNVKYGFQMEVVAQAQLAVKECEQGLIAFLSRFPFIGPLRARDAITRFGNWEGVINILDTAHERLTEINGITSERASEIKEAYDKASGFREFRQFAAKVGLNETLIAAAIEEWGEDAQGIIEADPFELMELPRGSFKLANEVHTKLQKDPKHPSRCAAGVLAAINLACDEGHTYVLVEDLHGNGRGRSAEEIRHLGLTVDEIQDGLKLLEKEHVRRRKGKEILVPPKVVRIDDRIYLREIYYAEITIARELARLRATRLTEVPVPSDAWGKQVPAPEQEDALRLACEEPVLIITGGPGCIDASSKLLIETEGRRSKGGREYTVEDAFHKFHRIPRKGKGGTKYWSGRVWTLSMHEDGGINYNEIKNIVFNGTKTVYEVKSTGGRRLLATADHPFKVPTGTPGADEEGFKRLNALRPGDVVIAHRDEVKPPEYGYEHRQHFRNQMSEEDTIEIIRLVGERPVYDLVMADPYRNYVAGGFVIHNCGKTFTTNTILNTLEAAGHALVLCAPTGKAAKRMTELTGREASTIHRLIGSGANTQINGSVIVVDEASMIDTELMATLLVGIRSGSRLVIVGDVDQLPSIGPGRVLFDLINSGTVPVVRLTRIFRQQSDGMTKRIPDVARAINESKTPELDLKGTDVTFIPFEDPELLQQKIVLAVTEQLPTKLGLSSEQIQVIAPQRGEENKTNWPIGVRALNIALQEALNPSVSFDSEIHIGEGYKVRADDRVIHVRNNYELGIMNGELGTVECVSTRPFIPSSDVVTSFRTKRAKEASTCSACTSTNGMPSNDKGSTSCKMCSKRATHEKASTVMVVNYADRKVGYTKEECREVQLAYALTVHKCQGSSYKAVVFPVHDVNQYMLTQPLLYTAITRAEQYVLLIGQAERVTKAVRNRRGVERRTSLHERMCTPEATSTALVTLEPTTHVDSLNQSM